ncbi:MAG: hypothetical protein AB8B61_08785 [Cyclobacteriaceae bacterium]
MEEAKALNSVSQFHQTFGHPIEKSPIIPSEARCNLRVALLAEELDELKEAIQQKDLVEIADALCDLQYVLSGAILEFGMGEKFSSLFAEVQRSNMSKACNTLEEVAQTKEHYLKRGDDSYHQEKDGKYLVFRKSDDKTLKSISYSPAELKPLL